MAGGSFRPTPLGDKATAGEDPIYELRAFDVVLLDLEVWELIRDIWTLRGLMAELSGDDARRYEILHALSRMVDVVDPADVAGTASEGRQQLAAVLAAPAAASAHKMVAVGHAHIDSAWLWPLRETVRKVARTWSNVADLADRDPDFVFACSSAQQYAWMKQYYPALFERIRGLVARGQFAPVGGMWVESDTNMPGGEAMARQFVAGKQFFLDEFGVETEEVWLPDSFGYSAALPQIVAASASRWFLTQKISWNQVNKMPHHTFWWEGIDGTRVFTHFPPADTYNSVISGYELAKASRQYAEKGAANLSLLPYGHGDGGGGPTREMIAAAHRTADLDGSPRVELSTPRDFFSRAEAEYANAPVWRGEMYLELHRGTLTSQLKTKQGNRRNEHLLREAELYAATAAARTGYAYPYERLAELWEMVLLLQFHDILPGSSIAWVHADAERNHAAITAGATEIIEAALAALTGARRRPRWPSTPHRTRGSGCPLSVPRSPSRVGSRPPPGCRPRATSSCWTTASSGPRSTRTGHARLADRPRRRPRGDQPRRARQPAAAAPRRAGQLGRLGHRRVLPPHGDRARRRRHLHRRGAAGSSPSVVRRPGRPSGSGSCWPPGRTPSSWSTRSTGTSSRSCSSSVSGSTCTPTRWPPRPSSATSTGPPTPTPRGRTPGSRPARTGSCTSASPATAWP